MIRDYLERRACLGCGADLSFRSAGVVADGGSFPAGADVYLGPPAFTIATIDGVAITGPVDPADPRAALTRSAEPFCRGCFDRRMARAVDLTDVPL